MKLIPELSHRSLETASHSHKSYEKNVFPLMGGLVLWCVRRCFVDKSLIKVWSRSMRAEKFVPKLNGLGIWLSGPSMALLSDRNALDKKRCFMRILTLNDVDFGPVCIK